MDNNSLQKSLIDSDSQKIDQDQINENNKHIQGSLNPTSEIINEEEIGNSNNQQPAQPQLLQDLFLVFRKPFKNYIMASINFRFSALVNSIWCLIKIIYFIVLFAGFQPKDQPFNQIILWSIFIAIQSGLGLIYFIRLYVFTMNKENLLKLAEKMNQLQFVAITEEKEQQFNKVFPGFSSMQQGEKKKYIDVWEKWQFNQGYYQKNFNDHNGMFMELFENEGLNEEELDQQLNNINNQNANNDNQSDNDEQDSNENNDIENQNQNQNQNNNNNNDFAPGQQHQSQLQQELQQMQQDQNIEHQIEHALQQAQNHIQNSSSQSVNQEYKDRDVALLSANMKFKLKSYDFVSRYLGTFQFIFYFGIVIWGMVLLFGNSQIYSSIFSGEQNNQAFSFFLALIISSHVIQYFDFYLSLILIAFLLPFLIIALIIWVVFSLRKNKKQKKISEKFKSVKYNPKKIPEDSRECNICMSDYVESDELIFLPCQAKHHFHAKCIREWLQVTTNCPLCRQQFDENSIKQQNSLELPDIEE